MQHIEIFEDLLLKKYKNWMQCALGVLLIWHNYALITAFGSCWWSKRAENLAEIDIARKLLVVTHCKLFPPSSAVFFSLFLLGSLCVQMGFYADISWKSKCNFEINVWAQFYKILVIFVVPYQPQVKMMPEKG